MADGIVVRDLNAWFGAAHVLHGIGVTIAPKAVTAVIGPSGCGKSTFIRCLNRMHEVVPGARVTGSVLVEGMDVYAPGLDPVQVRRKIGMVFQKPNPFPTMSVFDNVVAGLRLGGVRERSVLSGQGDEKRHTQHENRRAHTRIMASRRSLGNQRSSAQEPGQLGRAR